MWKPFALYFLIKIYFSKDHKFSSKYGSSGTIIVASYSNDKWVFKGKTICVYLLKRFMIVLPWPWYVFLQNSVEFKHFWFDNHRTKFSYNLMKYIVVDTFPCLFQGKEYGNMSVYSAMCRKFLDNVFQEKTALIDPDMTAQQMVQVLWMNVFHVAYNGHDQGISVGSAEVFVTLGDL